MPSPIDQICARIEELRTLPEIVHGTKGLTIDGQSYHLVPVGTTLRDVEATLKKIAAARNSLPGLLDALEKAVGVISFVLNDGKGREIFPPSNEWPGDAYKEVEDTLNSIAATLKGDK
jgi:hypothetical protein